MNTRLCLVEGWMLLALSATSFAQIGFQNGSFNSPGLPSGQPAQALDPSGSTFITGWTTVPGYNGTASGAVEYVGAWSQDPGGYCVELGYYSGVNAIKQTFSTTPSRPHLASFWLATDPFNGPPAILRVSAAGTSSDYQAPPGSGDSRAMGWQQQSFVFTSDNTGSTTLWFGNVVGIPAIDSITITEVPEADSDDDGVPDAQDHCPNTAPGAIVDADGCSGVPAPAMSAPMMIGLAMGLILVGLLRVARSRWST